MGEVKLVVTQKELNDIKVMFVQNKEKLDENEKELMRLRKERENDEVVIEEKMKEFNIREKERDDMIGQKEMNIEEQLEDMKSLKNKHACLENEKANNDIKDSTIEELNEKVCRITEEKTRIKSECDRIIEDMELSKKVAEDELLSQEEVAKETIWKLDVALSLQQQQHSSF